MIVMIFEFELNDAHIDEYKQVGNSLWQHIAEVDGFISLNRYRSVSNPQKMLAIGLFENEEAVQEWRNMPQHREAQTLGRKRLFTDYRLRMAKITRDYSLHDREQVPDDSREFHQIQERE